MSTSNIANTPSFTEIRRALDQIAQAETHITQLMQSQGIPGGRASIYSDHIGHPVVHLSASKRVFINHDGKRNLERTSVLYQNAAESIAEVGRHLRQR